MNADLHNLICLTAYGDQYIKGIINTPQNVALEKSIFHSGNKESFKDFEKNIVAYSCAGWYTYLKENGCKGLRLSENNDRIEAVYHDFSDYWSLQLTQISARQPISVIRINPKEVKEQLLKTLTEISRFACYINDLEKWVKWFDDAKAVLQNKKISKSYYLYRELIHIQNYPVLNQQLLMGATEAYVFGGMSSWNDAYLPQATYDQYRTLSEQLYADIHQAIFAAVNTTEEL